MKILLAIMSCWLCEANGDNQSLRDTWLRDVPPNVDYKFFHGQGYSSYPGSDQKFSRADIEVVPRDIIQLSAQESYLSLIERTRELYAGAFENGYDFVFKCYPDTYVDIPKLLSSGFENYDAIGYLHTSSGTQWTATKRFQYGFLGGGEGYWVSRHALDVIRNAEINPDPVGEDLWIGEEVLGPAGIRLVDHPGYGRGITLHGSILQNPVDYRPGRYEHYWMYDTYRRLKG